MQSEVNGLDGAQRFKQPALLCHSLHMNIIITLEYIYSMEYSYETPKFSTLMSHRSNCCLLDDLGRSMN